MPSTSPRRRTARPAASRKPRAIGYIRVSAVGGRAGPEYHTLEVQRKSIEEVCAARGYELIDVVVEENRSGADRARPKFREVMERLLDDEADAMAVWKVSRFSRSWKNAAADVELLLDADKDLVAGAEAFRTDDIGGRLLLRILLSMAEWERDVLKDGWEVIKQRVVERGVTLGHAPLGYRHGEGGVLEIDPATAPIAQECFRLILEGKSVGDVSRYLDEQVPQPRSVWGTAKTRRLLARRAYLGEARWRDQVTENAHEPLVSKADFAAVQAQLKTKKNAAKSGRSPTREYPLSGVLRCSTCGGPMSGMSSKGRGGKVNPSYLCSARQRCSAPMGVSAVIAEATVDAWMNELMAGLTLVADEEQAAGSLIAELNEKVAEAQLALDDMTSVKMRSALGSGWAPAMQKLAGEKLALEEELERELRSTGVVKQLIRWDELDGNARNEALRSALDRVEVLPTAKGRKPAERLRFVPFGLDEAESDAVTGT